MTWSLGSFLRTTTRHPVSTSGPPSQCEKGPSLARDGEEEAADQSWKKPAKFKRSSVCKDSDVGYLVSESKFLIADSLQAFVKHLVAGGKPEGGGGGSGSTQEPLGSPLDDEGGSVDVRGRDNPALFFQEMLVRITMQVHSLEHRLGRN